MRDQRDDVVRRFVEACRRADVPALRAALAVDAVAVCDGGGRVPAPARCVRGVQDVARLVALLLCEQAGTDLSMESVNGRAGLALRCADRVIAVVGVEVTGTAVTALWIALNPDKLRGWQRR
jgi:RNA polymerase sigma-70 factor (ECF subfamily)